MGKYKQFLYILEADNKKIRIWGKTNLDQLMDEAKINDYIRITYNGCKKTNNGRIIKKYNVERRISDD